MPRGKCKKGITLFTLIHDPINGKPDIIVLYQARDNGYAQISAHAGCFLEHLRLCLWVMSLLLMYSTYTVLAFLHVVCIICGSCWWLAYQLLARLYVLHSHGFGLAPWTGLAYCALPEASSAKLVKLIIIQCHKLIVIILCRLNLFVVIIHYHYYVLLIICSR